MSHNAHPKRNIGSAKRGEPSEAKSGKPINVVHMSSTFAPSLLTAIIFKRIGSHDCYRKRGLHLPIDEKNTGQGSGLFSQKKCKEGIQTPLDHRAINLQSTPDNLNSR